MPVSCFHSQSVQYVIMKVLCLCGSERMATCEEDLALRHDPQQIYFLLLHHFFNFVTFLLIHVLVVFGRMDCK